GPGPHRQRKAGTPALGRPDPAPDPPAEGHPGGHPGGPPPDLPAAGQVRLSQRAADGVPAAFLPRAPDLRLPGTGEPPGAGTDPPVPALPEGQGGEQHPLRAAPPGTGGPRPEPVERTGPTVGGPGVRPGPGGLPPGVP